MVELGGQFELLESTGGGCLGVCERKEEEKETVVVSLEDGTVSVYTVSRS